MPEKTQNQASSKAAGCYWWTALVSGHWWDCGCVCQVNEPRFPPARVQASAGSKAAGWMSYVATRPDQQRKGYARRVSTEALPPSPPNHRSSTPDPPPLTPRWLHLHLTLCRLCDPIWPHLHIKLEIARRVSTEALPPSTPPLSPYTLYSTPYTLHPAPYTLHPTPRTRTLHPTPCTLTRTPDPSPLAPTWLHTVDFECFGAPRIRMVRDRIYTT